MPNPVDQKQAGLFQSLIVHTNCTSLLGLGIIHAAGWHVLQPQMCTDQAAAELLEAVGATLRKSKRPSKQGASASTCACTRTVASK
jgi:hypothetical protein